MGVNNILKQFNSFSDRIEAGYKKAYDSSYNTNYDLVGSNGKIIHSDRRMTCFTRITETFNHTSGNWIEFGTGQKLYVYALSQDTILSESEIKKYLNFVKKLGLSFKLHIKEDYDLNYMKFVRKDSIDSNINLSDYATVFTKGNCSRYDHNSFEIESMLDKTTIEYDTTKPLVCFKRQKVYILEIDLNVHKTMATVKLLLYLFRFIYEFDFDILVKKTLEYKSKYPKYDFITILNLMNHYIYHAPRDMKYNDLYTDRFKTGHNIFKYIYSKLTTKAVIKNLKKTIDRELKFEYNNNSINDIFNFKKVELMVNSRYGKTFTQITNYFLTFDMSIDQFFMNIKKETDIEKLTNSSGYTLIKVLNI